MPSRSYSSTKLGPVERAKELVALYRFKRRDIPGQVRRTVRRLGAARDDVEADLGRPVDGIRRVLVIGPGQHLAEMRFWGRAADLVVGIDLDPYPGRPTLRRYVRGLADDGLVRTAKTAGRRLSGLDRAYRKELDRQLGGTTRKPLTVLSMDAGRTAFSDASFDVVYSRSVFEHLRDPGAALDEIARILRPGGVAHIDLHLYTCDSGCHDARIFAGNRADLPYWAHLRPAHAGRVRPNSFLNELRLGDWREAFTRAWPGVGVELRPSLDPELRAALPELRAAGELSGYTDEELLTVSVIARWRHPATSQDGPASSRDVDQGSETDQRPQAGLPHQAER
jgi:SAM-dependent methyltransferase